MADITFTGFLGADPEIKFTSSGKAVANFSVAESHRRRSGTEWEDDGTTWWRVTVWERAAETLAEHLRKGARVIVAGQVRSREFEHNGQQRTSYDVTARHVGIIPKADQQAQPAPAGDAWGAPGCDEPPF